MSTSVILDTVDRLELDLKTLREIAATLDFRSLRGDRTQEEIACIAQVCQATLSRLEHGKLNGIATFQLIRILRVYLGESNGNATIADALA